MEKDWIYYGLFLSDDSKELLIDTFKDAIPDGWKLYCDHMTVIYNDHSEEAEWWGKSCSGKIGKKAVLFVSHIGISDKAIAVKVYGYPTHNKIPHITIAVSPNGKPVDSNGIVDWWPVNDGVSLSAEMRCIYRNR